MTSHHTGNNSTSLNNIGVRLFEAQSYSAAMDKFRQAETYAFQSLGHTGDDLTRTHEAFTNTLPSINSSSKSRSSFNPRKRKYRDTDGSKSNINQIIASLRRKYENFARTESASKTESRKVKQIQHEYDEGMNILQNAFFLERSCEEMPAIFHNIANVYCQTDNFNEAIQYYFKCLSIINTNDNQNGENTTSFLILCSCLHNIGRLYYSMKCLDEALETYQAALTIMRENLDETCNNGIVAATLNCIGLVYYSMPVCQVDKALQYFKESLQLQRMSLNSCTENLQIGTIMNNIGRCYFCKEDYEMANLHYKVALDIRRSILGPYHLDVGATAFNMGQVHHRIGNYSLAKTCYTLYLSTARFNLGPNNHAVIIGLSWIGKLYHTMNDFEESEKFYQEALQMSSSVLGKGHPDLTILLNRIGNLSYDMGDFDQALQVFKMALKNEKLSVEPNPENLIVTLANISDIHQRRGSLKESIKTYQSMISIQKKYGHPELAATYKTVGHLLTQELKYSEALLSYQEALRLHIKEEEGPKKYKAMVPLMCNIGFVLFKMKKYQLALQSFEEALTARSHLGEEANYYDERFIFYNIAMIYHQEGEYDSAVKYFEKTLQMEIEALGKDHEDVAVSRYQLGQVYYDQKDFDKAIEQFEEASRIERLSGDESSLVRSLNAIGQVCVLIGDVRRMMDTFAELTRINGEATFNPEDLGKNGQDSWEVNSYYPEAAPAA